MARKKDTSSASSTAAKKKKKPGRLKEMWKVFKMTQKADPSTTWVMLLIFVAILGLAMIIGALIGQLIYATIIGLPFGLLGAMFVLARRAERAAYSQIEGQPGAVGAALNSIRRGWSVEEEPVAIDPRSQDMIFRAVGRAGVCLIGEGPQHRVKRLMTAEERKIKRILPNVPIHTLFVGRGQGEVPLPKLVAKMQKMKPKLTKLEVTAVSNRIRTIGGVRRNMGVPKGVDPTKARPDRRGMRGR